MATLSTFLNKKPQTDLKASEENTEEAIEMNTEKTKIIRKFLVMSTYGELLDLAIWLSKVEEYQVLFFVTDNEYKKIGQGIVETMEDWHEYLGQDYIWVIDGTETAKLQDWLRGVGESVVGTNEIMSELEENRQKGQAWFRRAGFNQPESKNFTNIDEATQFVKENKDKIWILKQNGTLPKSLNHKGKFKGGEDMIFHLDELKKNWSQEWGEFDCDLMEVVDGLELAASAFFNGHDWLRDKDGHISGFLNFEFKKQVNGDLGATTGEMGTVFLGVTDENQVFKDIIDRPEVLKQLMDSDYRGVFDINCIKTKDGIVALEATSRFGIPSTSYEFGEGLLSDCGELLEAMARGIDSIIEVNPKWGIAQVIVAPPFPVEADIEKGATSLGQKLWILRDKRPVKDMDEEQIKHIRLENFEKKPEGYRVATKQGYMLVVTGTGDTIEETRESLLNYIKQNLFLSDMSYRTDLGKRIEDHENEIY
jgi:phosphoribosylamine-glycine ligase